MFRRSFVAVVVAVATGLFAAPVHASPAKKKRKALIDKLGIEEKAPPKTAEPTPPPQDEPPPQPSTPPSGPPPSGGSAPTEPAAPPAASAPSVTYTGRIHKMLQSDCKGCHQSGGAAGGTRLTLTGDVGRDYAAAKKLVDVAQPSKSVLLTKAAGRSHLGGTTYPQGSSKYRSLQAWIAAGAPRSASTPAPVVAAPTPIAPAPPPSATAPAVPIQPRTTPRKKATVAGRSAAPVVAPSETIEPDIDAGTRDPSESIAEPIADPPTPGATEPPASAPPPKPAPAPPVRAYAPAVHDLLTSKCMACHKRGAIAGQGALALTGNAVADYETTVALVDVASPGRSRLLQKATGREHGGGATITTDSPAYREILAWIEAGAQGPTAADIETTASEAAEDTAPPPTEGAEPLAVDATSGASPPPKDTDRLGDGTPLGGAPNHLPFSLPFDMRLNGKLDFSYERRAWKDHPFQRGKNAFATYHHFLFLSRASAKDPFGFNVELITQSFYEFNARIAPKRHRFDVLFKAGKIMVPFGNEPLFHKSYGGRSGFDQEILPTIWAQPGIAASVHVHAGPVSFKNDLYTVQGYALRAPDAVLNLQSDVSTFDSFRAAFGDRVGVSWHPLTAWYSVQIGRLGYDRLLLMQAVDLEMWRLRDVPVLKNFVLGVGGMRADVSGGGPGLDYYHFGSYLTLGYFPVKWLYLQYRGGLRTTDNRRGVYFDSTRRDERDRSSHNVSIIGRYKGFYAGLQMFWNLEKANEQKDDFLRVTVGYEF